MANAPFAFVTLITSDSYLPGALTLAAAINDLHTQQASFRTVCLVAPETVDVSTIKLLRRAFNIVIGVEIIGEDNSDKLKLLGRPDLNTVLTKLHAFRLTQFEKIIFLDADVLPIRSLAHLFTLPYDFAAVPDVGWPDIFNSGVMVFTPGEHKFNELMDLSKTKGSWDGGDQGLLNEWRGENWHRLSFTYNTTPTAAYTYAPAYERFGSKISAIHFIGPNKPWSSIPYRAPGSAATERTRTVSMQPISTPQSSNTTSPNPQTQVPLLLQAEPQRAYDYGSLVDRWYAVYDRHYRSQVLPSRPEFEVQRYVSAWNESDPDYIILPASRPRSGGVALGLEELRRIALEGIDVTSGSDTDKRDGQYIRMPLEGRVDLMRPKKPEPELGQDLRPESTSTPVPESALTPEAAPVQIVVSAPSTESDLGSTQGRPAMAYGELKPNPELFNRHPRGQHTSPLRRETSEPEEGYTASNQGSRASSPNYDASPLEMGRTLAPDLPAWNPEPLSRTLVQTWDWLDSPLSAGMEALGGQLLSPGSITPVRWETLPTPGASEIPPAPYLRALTLPSSTPSTPTPIHHRAQESHRRFLEQIRYSEDSDDGEPIQLQLPPQRQLRQQQLQSQPCEEQGSSLLRPHSQSLLRPPHSPAGLRSLSEPRTPEQFQQYSVPSPLPRDLRPRPHFQHSRGTPQSQSLTPTSLGPSKLLHHSAHQSTHQPASQARNSQHREPGEQVPSNQPPSLPLSQLLQQQRRPQTPRRSSLASPLEGSLQQRQKAHELLPQEPSQGPGQPRAQPPPWQQAQLGPSQISLHDGLQEPSSQDHSRPKSPPLLSWNPAVEPPPKDPSSTSSFVGSTYFPNVWDESAHNTHEDLQQASFVSGSPPDSHGLFQLPPPSKIPETLLRRGEYENVTGPSNDGPPPSPDHSKVRTVFPWEEKPRRYPARVFPASDLAPPGAEYIQPPPPIVSSPSEHFKPSTSSTIVKLPGTFSFPNSWDEVPSIQKYASKLVRPPAPSVPVMESGRRRKSSETYRRDDSVDRSGQEGDVEDEISDDELTDKGDIWGEGDGATSRQSHSASSRSGGSHSGSPRATRKKKEYRSQGVQTILRETRSQGVQVAVAAGKASSQRPEVRPSLSRTATRVLIASSGTQPPRDYAQSPDTYSPIHTSTPPPGTKQRGRPENLRKLSDERSSSASPASSVGSKGSALTSSRKPARVFDPARGVDLFKRNSEEVLARFLKMGSWEDDPSTPAKQ